MEEPDFLQTSTKSQPTPLDYRRIVIKVGSNVIADEDGLPDIEILARLVKEIIRLKKKGKEIILISSGAVAAGRGLVTKREGQEENKQMLAAIGQVRMINIYNDLFAQFGLFAAQVMVTKGEFRNQSHYLNIQNCFDGLLNRDVIPIVNENDVIANSELSFTDNDELSGLIACMVHAQAVFILTNVDGLYDRNPTEPSAKILRTISSDDEDIDRFIAPSKSTHGRGGMATKAKVAQRLAHLGVHAHLVNGRKHNAIKDLMDGHEIGTHFLAAKRQSDHKGWLTHLDNAAKGKIFVDYQTSQKMILNQEETNLTAENISHIEGQFEEGDIVQVHDAANQEILATAMADVDHETANEAIYKESDEPIVNANFLSIAHELHIKKKATEQEDEAFDEEQ